MKRNIFVADGVLQTVGHPLADRLAVFREMAAEARRDAAHAASSEARLDHERLATSWDQLISEIVAAMDAGKR
jgi:hypothetical protein